MERLLALWHWLRGPQPSRYELIDSLTREGDEEECCAPGTEVSPAERLEPWPPQPWT